jgi:hypothetical protein
MAGKRCNGNAESGPVPIKDSGHYCDGRRAAAAGVLVGANPHTADTVESDLWIAGHESWAADPDGVPRDCCADAYGGGYTP